MIVAFSGDPFLARRSARQELRERGVAPGEVMEHGEGLVPEQIEAAVHQAGLFGATVLLLDFDVAFEGQAGVAPRAAAMKALATVPGDALVVVIDSKATAARQKAWRELGTLEHQPTPRFAGLRGWIAKEAEAKGLRIRGAVPAVLADLFGEDLPALAAEIEKLAVLDEVLDEARVRELVRRPASRDAFDLIDAITAGDEATAVRTARLLLDAGEAAPRILGALVWQASLVARAVALRERDGDVAKAVAAKALGAAPFPAGKAMDIARRLDEHALREVFDVLLEVESAIKTGRREPGWAIEACALELATRFARRQPA
ncbi:MAG: DNA polymerase III subunit delta [Trueperaceae bacterium]|nr:DNA polymerase III subunit delta [Trueperaceae bacterium]